MRSFSALIPLLYLVSMTAVASPFSSDRAYHHANFATEEACHKAQKQFMVNCYQTVRFRADGRVNLIVTDILNAGTYDVQGDSVSLKFNGAEVSRFHFTLSADGESLVDDAGLTWNRQEK